MKSTLHLALYALFVIGLSNGTYAQTQAKEIILEEFHESLTELPAESTLSKRGVLYVPAYSSIFVDSRAGRVTLATTLTIHNTSETMPLVIERIDYFDSAGKLKKQFLDVAVALRPYSTLAILVPEEIEKGGIGANFKVVWAASSRGSAPAVEAVMIGRLGTNSYSFVSPGRPLDMVEAQ